MNPRIGLIIPSSNRLAEPQFQRYAPKGVGVHVTRLRMTGMWHRPLADLEPALAEAAAALGDTRPGVIVFHCTANSMEGGLAGEARVREIVERASGCPAMTTGRAVTEALAQLRIKRPVLISPYVAETNQHEIRFLREAGVDVVHDHGLGLRGGGDEYIGVTPERWTAIALEHRRAEADGYFLSCTNTTMIEVVDDLEARLDRPVVTSNQAALWAALRRLEVGAPGAGPGRLFRET